MATQSKTTTIEIDTIISGIKDKAKTAFTKGSAVVGEIGTMTKGNVEAVVASGKALGFGLKELGEGSVAEGKQAVDTFVADLKSYAAIKSPADFFELQMSLAQRNIDAAFALGAKNGKAFEKLAGDVAAPLAMQAKANVGKLRNAA